MTRDTKIGLLIGLGFIVVFAVLIASLTTTQPAKMGQPLVSGSSGPSNTLPSDLARSEVKGSPKGSPRTVTQSNPPVTTAPARPNPASPTRFAKSPDGDTPPRDTFLGPLAKRLPNIDRLGPSFQQWLGSGDKGVNTLLTARKTTDTSDDATTTSLVSNRVAPQPLTPPRPSVSQVAEKPDTASLKPVQDIAVAKNTNSPNINPKDKANETALSTRLETDNALTAKDKTALSTDLGTDKLHIVQKGDNLIILARKYYGKSTPKVLDYIVSQNKGLKDRNRLIQGQTLEMPDLPPDMFEPVTSISFNAAKLTSYNAAKPITPSATADNADIPMLSRERRAPQPSTIIKAKDDKDKNKGSTGDVVSDKIADKTDKMDKKVPDKAVAGNPRETSVSAKSTAAPGKKRTYTIQTKDTLGSIAAKELGSATLWPEILKANGNLDPKKMQPGTEIKLPAKQTVPASNNSKNSGSRVSA